MDKTHTNPFNQEKIEYLKVNHSVKNITMSAIHFTEEFKKYSYEHYHSDMTARQIFIEYGIDPDILGESRIDGFFYRLNKQSKHVCGFADNRSNNHQQPSKGGKLTVESRLNQLEHELAYIRQEVEFFKNCKWQMQRQGKNGNPSISRSDVCNYKRS